MPDECVTNADELTLPTHTGLTLEVCRLRVRRFNGRVLVHVGFTNGAGVTLRIAAGRVQEMGDLLAKVATHG